MKGELIQAATFTNTFVCGTCETKGDTITGGIGEAIQHLRRLGWYVTYRPGRKPVVVCLHCRLGAIETALKIQHETWKDKDYRKRSAG